MRFHGAVVDQLQSRLVKRQGKACPTGMSRNFLLIGAIGTAPHGARTQKFLWKEDRSNRSKPVCAIKRYLANNALIQPGLVFL
jgi:hypothetical protein